MLFYLFYCAHCSRFGYRAIDSQGFTLNIQKEPGGRAEHQQICIFQGSL